MRLGNPNPPTEDNTTPRVDWTKPVIIFDPWPFDEDVIAVQRCRWYNHPSFKEDDIKWYLAGGRGEDNVLGQTTDGMYFVTSEEGLEQLKKGAE